MGVGQHQGNRLTPAGDFGGMAPGPGELGLDLGPGLVGQAGFVEVFRLALDLLQNAGGRVPVVGQGRAGPRLGQRQRVDAGHGLGQERQVLGQARRPALDVIDRERAHGQGL